jgi:hypothetical protein
MMKRPLWGVRPPFGAFNGYNPLILSLLSIALFLPAAVACLTPGLPDAEVNPLVAFKADRGGPGAFYCRLKNCTARSCFSTAFLDVNVPRFLRLPVFGFFFLE